MTRTVLAAGLLAAGLSAAQAQTVTPGIGGVAITGQSGAGVYLPWNGGAVVGAPGVGSYRLGSGTYVSPYSWNQFNDPTAYNFNTGGFNYSSGVYGWNNGLTTTSYYGSPYGGTYYSGSPYTGYSYPVYSGGWTTPRVYTNTRGRLRWR